MGGKRERESKCMDALFETSNLGICDDNATASLILSINRKFTKLMACSFQFSFIKVTP